MAATNSYATVEEVSDLIALPEGDTVTDADVETAELDVDRELGYHGARDPDTGRKLDPERLVPYRRALLVRAVAAQVRYRIDKGAEFFNRPQLAAVAGDGFTATGRQSYFSPEAHRYLTDAGLVNRFGSVVRHRSAAETDAALWTPLG